MADDGTLKAERLEQPTRLRMAREVMRLAWTSDAFAAQALYRVKAPVVIEPAIYLPHGQIVLDGLVRIGAGSAIRPWETWFFTPSTFPTTYVPLAV